MSTRCQIGFYPSEKSALKKPSALIYRHCDGYPDPPGVLATLVAWAKDFHVKRGLDDAEYASARALVALIRTHQGLDETLGYGICGDHGLHSDIEYFYRVDPSGVTVYSQTGDGNWITLKRVQKVRVAAKKATTP